MNTATTFAAGDFLYQHTKDGLVGVLRMMRDEGMLPENARIEAVVLESPKDPAHGDLATNAAMVLAREAGKAPRQLAEEIAQRLEKLGDVAQVEVAGPGFINVWFTPQALWADVAKVTEAGDSFGKVDISGGKRALVEYVSINPTGPIHVGHGRNAVFGDAIALLLEKAGYPVEREYLMNDAGGQIRVLVRSLHARYRQLFGEDVEVPADGYPGEYLIDIAEALKARDGDKWLAERDEDVLLKGLRAFAVDACMALIKKDIETLGIEFDTYFSEYAMHQTDAMPKAVALLRDKGVVYEGTLPPPKGKEIKDYQAVELTLFKATEFGLADDQPIYKRSGEPTYFGQDIAYHYNKLQRGFRLLVTVIGVDQAGSFKPLEKAIEALTGEKNLYRPVPYEMVKVLRNGQPVKLSKRAGNIVLLSDVLEEVGKDAFRYLMLTVKPTTPLTFDLAKAVEKSMENPVFYVQYAHARLASVFRQADELGIKIKNVFEVSDLDRSMREVVRQIMLYPLAVEQAAEALEPHRMANYAQALAAAVHHWYGAEKWLDAEDVEATSGRLAVARAAQGVLADALRLCGVSAPERM